MKKKLIENIGLFEIPLFYTAPAKARTEHFIRGNFLGWHIVDQLSLKRELKTSLNAEEILLSPHGHPNDALLIQWLESNWRLENWK